MKIQLKTRRSFTNPKEPFLSSEIEISIELETPRLDAVVDSALGYINSRADEHIATQMLLSSERSRVSEARDLVNNAAEPTCPEVKFENA